MLLGGAAHGEARDDLDRFYTTDRLARMCLERMLVDVPPGGMVLEPSCGGGAFVRAASWRWPGVDVVALDVDPDADGFRFAEHGRVADFLTERPRELVSVVVGNPPFAGESRGLEHVRRALMWGDVVGFILPIARAEGTGGWGEFLDEHPPVAVHPIAGRPWNVVRGCAFWVWHRQPGAYRWHQRITGWR